MQLRGLKLSAFFIVLLFIFISCGGGGIDGGDEGAPISLSIKLPEELLSDSTTELSSNQETRQLPPSLVEAFIILTITGESPTFSIVISGHGQIDLSIMTLNVTIQVSALPQASVQTNIKVCNPAALAT